MALSFADLKELHTDDKAPEMLECIATPHERRCNEDLSEEQLSNLRDLLHATPERMNLEEVREIINCVICVRHQKGNYRHKDKIEKKWAEEFPHLNFLLPRKRSRLSLSSGNSTPQRTSSRPSTSSSRASLRPTPSSTRSDSSVLLRAPPQRPQFRRQHARSVSASEMRDISPSDISLASYPVDRMHISTDDSGEDIPDTPTTNRGPPRTRGPTLNVPGAISEEDAHLPRQRSTSSPPSLVGRRTGRPNRTVQADQASSPSESRFENGESSDWAPWTIRSQVQELMIQPIPLPKDKGSIYVAQVENVVPPIVKIGITYQPYRERIKQVAKAHGSKFNMGTTFHRAGIPILQLERLEKLVHTDLAFFQRNWRVQTDRSYKTHHEYFEVDMKVAQETIDLWREVLRTSGLKTGTGPDETFFKSLDSDPDAGVEASSGTDPADYWRRLNGDHNRRMRLWRKHLLKQNSLFLRVRRFIFDSLVACGITVVFVLFFVFVRN